MKFKEELVQILATDKALLPGILFEPVKKTKRVLILLHGNGSSSVFRDMKENKIMGEILTRQGISYLAFNNRGSGLINKLLKEGSKKRVMGGMAYELIKDCIKDIDGAINFLKRKGYREFSLIGFSTGANKICLYDFYKKTNFVSRYILVGGGDDSGIYYNQFGKQKFLQLLKEAKRKIRLGKGNALVPFEKVGMVMSYKSLYDIMSPDAPYNVFPFHYYFHKMNLGKKKFFKEYSKIKKPSLVIYGEKDEYCYGKVPEIVQALMRYAEHPNNKKFVLFKNADHSLHGKEHQLGSLVGEWLSQK